MFGLSPRTARSVARALLLVLGLGGALLTSHAVLGQAHGQSKAQQHLQKILARQRYWQGRLKAERKQELALETRLTTTNLHLTKQQQKLQAEKARASNQQARIEETIAQYQQQISNLHAQVLATRSQYDTVHAEAAGLLKRLRVLKARIHRESHHVAQAIVEMYQLSQVSPLETVLEAPSLTQFLNQQNMVDQIGTHDAGILRWAQREHALVHAAAAAYIAKMADLKSLQAQERVQLQLMVVETQHENLLLIQERQLTARRQAKIKQTESSIRALAQQEQSQLDSVAGTAKSTKRMIRQNQRSAERVAWIIAQQTGRFPHIAGLNNLQWPLLGVLTQPFGPSPYAFEPAVTYHGHYYPHFHTGIDIAAPFQTPIQAAAAGKIIFAGLFVPGQVHASYGLCVIIMHNSTLSTLYAHMDIGLGLRVHVGQVVSQGQVIGYEGLTGNTTGPHLHFEVRIGGEWVNPLFYLPKQPNVT